jgi:hypothetical protein
MVAAAVAGIITSSSNSRRRRLTRGRERRCLGVRWRPMQYLNQKQQ